MTKMISKSPMRKKGWVPFKNIDKRITNNCLPFSISPLKRRQTCRFFLLVVLQQYQISRALLSIVFLPLVKFCQYISSTPSNGSLKHHLSLVGCFWLVSDKIIILFRMSTPSLLGAFQIHFCGFFPQSGDPHSAIVLTKNKGNFWPKNTIVST